VRVYIDQFWRRAKTPFAISLGPVQLLLSMRRAVKISNNRRRRELHARAWDTHTAPAVRDTVLPVPDPKTAPVSTTDVAVIVGAGPGFGHAVATRLADAGFRVALVSRNAERHDPLVAKLQDKNPWVHAYGCDATHESSVVDMFKHVVEDFGAPTLVVYAVQEGGCAKFLEAEAAAVEHAWRSNCLGAFIVAKEAGRHMVARGKGTIVLVGATSGLFGRAGYVTFAPGKFGLRALGQVAARELGPLGVHVAHLVIDADIDESGGGNSDGPTMQGADIAELVYQLHRQPRSAWTQELDARPYDERYWEHC
jgi:NAD(P)-dependent dehydrogenase (short-subunit alcohol dehydrogenase family)